MPKNNDFFLFKWFCGKFKQFLNWEGIFIATLDSFSGGKLCYDDEFGVLYSFESSEVEMEPHVIVKKYFIGDLLKVK